MVIAIVKCRSFVDHDVVSDVQDSVLIGYVSLRYNLQLPYITCAEYVGVL